MAGVDELDDGDQPLFVYAHILAPHFPHRYQPDCALRGTTFVEGYELSGAERLAERTPPTSECLDREFVGVGRPDLVADDPDAVIIVQSDHGSRFSFDWDMPMDRWTATNFSERFGALNAIRLPEACRGDASRASRSSTPSASCSRASSGAEPDLLPSRTFFSEFHEISTLAEVPPEAFDAALNRDPARRTAPVRRIPGGPPMRAVVCTELGPPGAARASPSSRDLVAGARPARRRRRTPPA